MRIPILVQTGLMRGYWTSKKKNCTCQSTVEAEYVVGEVIVLTLFGLNDELYLYSSYSLSTDVYKSVLRHPIYFNLVATNDVKQTNFIMRFINLIYNFILSLFL